jgi:hypothetical protein
MQNTKDGTGYCRPASLEELGARHDDPRGWHASKREFLDEFYMARPENRESMLAGEPRLTGDAVIDVYLAAMAEHLANEYGLPCPQWAHNRERFLHLPEFPCKLENMKAYLLASTPGAFRRRMLFVGDDPLSRPAKYAVNTFAIFAEETCGRKNFPDKK